MHRETVHPVDDSGWWSLHLGFQGDIYSSVADRLILEVAEPLVRRAQELTGSHRFFFVRYLDATGPHLRLRLEGDPQRLAAHLDGVIEELVATVRDDDGGPLVRTVNEVPYEPEIARYGGPLGVLAAERHFHRSSEIAVELVGQMLPGKRSSRMGKGLLASLVMLHTLFSDRRAVAARYFRWYGASYLQLRVPDPEMRRRWMERFTQGHQRQAARLAPHVEAAWAALSSFEALTPTLDHYRAHLAAFKEALRELLDRRLLWADGGPLTTWEQCAEVICPSYLHMMSNRLGLSIQDECYLSVVIASILGSREPHPATSGAPMASSRVGDADRREARHQPGDNSL